MRNTYQKEPYQDDMTLFLIFFEQQNQII